MKHSTTTKPKDGATSPSFAEPNNSKNYPLLHRHQLEKTPFYIVGANDIGWRLTWGKYTFNDEPLPTEGAVIDWYWNNLWEITLHLIAIGITTAQANTHKPTEKPK